MRLFFTSLFLGLFVFSVASDAVALDARTRPLAKAAFDSVRKQQWDKAASFAAQTRDRTIIDAVEWFTLTRAAQIPDFQRIASFYARHPDWPSKDIIERRAEIALLSTGYDNRTMSAWFSAHPPQTAFGKYKWMKVTGKTIPREVIINTWINGDFSLQEETTFLAVNYGQLTAMHHAQRVDRLLWEGKISNAKRYISSSPAAQRPVFDARIALMQNSPSANALVQRVPASLANEEGLLYERAAWRKRKKLWDGIAEMVLKAPANSINAKKWWPYRNIAIREALNKQQYGLAEQLAARFGTLDRVEEAEALWLRGWIALSFRGKPSQAFEDFKRLYSIAQYPISKARGAYWAALAAKRMGNTKVAQEWFHTAGKYPTSFYGQLAAEEMVSRLQISPAREATAQEVSAYAARTPMAMLVLMMAEAGAEDLSVVFINHLIHTSPRTEDRAAIVGLGTRAGRPDLSIRAAKEAQRYDLYFMQTGYPLISIPPTAVVEPALIHAFTRQESMFHPRATSPADARGLMQILPGTGKVLARRINMPFNPNTLYQPEANVRLGSLYIAELQDRFGGALALTAAGYNAGPGRPTQWSRQFGRPGGADTLKTLNWIESIPFSETRNYVQRVMENYQVYRWKLGNGAKINLKELLAQ